MADSIPKTGPTGSRNKWLFCLAFLACLGVLLAGLSLYFLPKDNTPEAGIQNVRACGVLGEPENTLDYLVLGDSLPLTGVNPWVIWERQGFTGYVCAATGQDTEGSAQLLEAALENQAPRVIFLEAHQLYKEIDAVDAAVRQVCQLVPVLQYHDNWKFLSPKEALRPVQYTNRPIERGYYLRKAVCGTDPGDYMAPTDGEDPIPRESARILKRIARSCREQNIELVLFSLPSPANWSDAAHRAVDALAAEMGISYLDLNLTDLSIDWSRDTLDGGDHLNEAGAEKASAFLGTYLAEKHTLEDKRLSPAYARWQQDFDTFTALASAAEDTL